MQACRHYPLRDMVSEGYKSKEVRLKASTADLFEEAVGVRRKIIPGFSQAEALREAVALWLAEQKRVNAKRVR